MSGRANGPVESEAPLALADLVDAFWLEQARAPGRSHLVVPDGCLDLVFELGEEGRGSASAFGPVSSPTEVVLEAGVAYAGIRLRPWVGAPLLGATGAALVDASETLTRVRGTVFDLPETEGALDRMLGFATQLHAELRWTPAQRAVREAYQVIAASAVVPTASALGRRLGCAERTLRRAFDAVTGQGPKTALRIVRCQRALRQIEAGQALADVAHGCGYADQSHLTNELKRLARVTPGALKPQARLEA